ASADEPGRSRGRHIGTGGDADQSVAIATACVTPFLAAPRNPGHSAGFVFTIGGRAGAVPGAASAAGAEAGFEDSAAAGAGGAGGGAAGTGSSLALASRRSSGVIDHRQ